jgi:hypothetical protein
MPLPRSRLVRSWLRAGLALVLAGAFGFRITGTLSAWGCTGDGVRANAPGHAGHHGHHEGTPGSASPLCVCVAHGSGAGLALEPPRLVAAFAFPARLARSGHPGGMLLVPADRHLLPFSIGPPASLA